MAPMAAELRRTPAFAPPTLPLVDGTGRLWPTGDACDTAALREYTIHEQIVSPYRFATSLEVRARARARTRASARARAGLRVRARARLGVGLGLGLGPYRFDLA